MRKPTTTQVARTIVYGFAAGAAAITAGTATRTLSTLIDGKRHYALVRYDAGLREVAINLTGTEHDNREAAEHLARIRNVSAPVVRSKGVVTYAAERIA